MKFEISANPLEQISSDGALVFAYQEKKAKSENKTYIPLESFMGLDKILGGQIKKVCDLEQFTGKRGEVLKIIPSDKLLTSRIIVVGLGMEEEFVVNDLRRAIGKAASQLKNIVSSISLSLPKELGIKSDISELTSAIGEGFILGSYEFNAYKKQQKNNKNLENIIISENNLSTQKNIYQAIKHAEIVSKATILARNLINEQASIATPSYLADVALDIAKSCPQVKVKIYDREDLDKIGMNGLLGFARASDTQPKFIHLEYQPDKNESKKKIALIGKGITFDSGGINIKPSQFMTDMKCDMSGAAAVLGIFSVIADIKPNSTVMGLIAATPNLISGNSILPGDVVRAYNKKTIEIIDTDAEGRVTLADSLSYAVEKGATEIIDLATLTGACLVALGTDIAALFSNNRDLAEKVKRYAYESGEKVWELPLEQEYKELNKSDIADVANLATSRYGGSITAALFLEEFVDNKPWVHLDIAGPAFMSKATDLAPKGGTGFFVRTLLNFLNKEG